MRLLYRQLRWRGPFRPVSRRTVLAALARHRCEVLRDIGKQMVGLDEGWLQ